MIGTEFIKLDSLSLEILVQPIPTLADPRTDDQRPLSNEALRSAVPVWILVTGEVYLRSEIINWFRLFSAR
jgi:hypothetical protein